MNISRFSLGDFNVSSSTMLVSDPCYDDEVSSEIRGKIDGVRPGRWTAYVTRGEVSGWGTRNLELQVFHESASPQIGDSSIWMKPGDFMVGVDSGQAGFYDAAMFPSDPGDYSDESSMYRRICETTDNSLGGGTIDLMGATSCSGFGDGGYECFVMRNADDEIVGAKVIFINEEEDLELIDSESSLFDEDEVEEALEKAEELFSSEEK